LTSRTDLSVALRFGTRPFFFRDDLCWDPYLTSRITVHHPDVDGSCGGVDRVVECLDQRLLNIYKDLRAFACLSNLSWQTTRELQPSLVNEVMVSTMYRLMYLSFEPGNTNEVVRSGLLAFAVSVFLQVQHLPRRYDQLSQGFRDTILWSQDATTRQDHNHTLCLWLFVVYAIVFADLKQKDWAPPHLRQAVQALGVRTWKETRLLLKSIMWIDFVHDVPGKELIEAALAVP
jgi:hypothetical protein